MAKIMLVEDDNNLREIYEARLLAEGHEIISAHDGEEALALAVRERPELIISDVMMPKISGFDMLDILRSSPETKDTKVIMMTALSQLDDKDRADRLGADRYLVKSQVTLEDVIRVAKEVLEGTPSSSGEPNTNEPVAPIGGAQTTMPPTPPTPQQDQQAADTPLATPPADNAVPNQTAADTPIAIPADNATQDTSTVVPEPAESTTDSTAPMPEPSQDVAPAPEATPVPEPAPEAPAANPQEVASVQAPAEAPAVDTSALETAQSANTELNKVEQQIDNFINSNPSGDPVATPDPEAPVVGSPDSAPTVPPAAEPAPEAPAVETPSVPDGFVNDSAPEQPAEAAPPQTPEQPAENVVPATSEVPAEVPATDTGANSPSASKKTIQPIGDPLAKPDLDGLAAKEAELEAAQQVLNNAAQAPVAPAPSEVPAPAPEQPTQTQQTPASDNPSDPNMIAL